MSTTVDSQSTALNECLVARLVITGIGTFIGVYPVMALEIGLAIETLYDASAISLWFYWDLGQALTRGNSRRKITYLGAALMPIALERASGHVGSRGSAFDHGTLLGGCLVHHGWRMATD